MYHLVTEKVIELLRLILFAIVAVAVVVVVVFVIKTIGRHRLICF